MSRSKHPSFVIHLVLAVTMAAFATNAGGDGPGTAEDRLGRLQDDQQAAWPAEADERRQLAGRLRELAARPTPAPAPADSARGPGFEIHGTVSRATGGPLTAATVFLMQPHWEVVDQAATDGVTGEYAITGILPGTYYVVALDSGYYIGEAHPDILCPEYCDLENSGATPIEVTGPGSLEIDFALDLGGVIEGYYTDAATGAPLDNVGFDMSDLAGTWYGFAGSDDSGTGTSYGPAFPAGDYTVRTSNLEGYFEELYDDHLCVCEQCEITDGDPVTVIAGQNTLVSIALDLGRWIGGTVTDGATTDPVADAYLSIYDEDWNYRGWGRMQNRSPHAPPEYDSCALLPGPYYAVMANDGGEYVPELYDDVPCPEGWACDLNDGTPIALPPEPGQVTADFVLDVGGTVCGQVTESATGSGLAGVLVQLWDAGWNYRGSAWTDDFGDYAIIGLPAGATYATTFETGCHVGQVWDGVPCPGGWSCQLTDGASIPVALGGIHCPVDFALDQGGTISGSAICDGQGPAWGSVDVYDPLGFWITSDFIEPLEIGDYLTPALPLGTYRVATTNTLGCVDEVFDNLPLPWTPIVDGTPVPVAACVDTGGIDFLLSPPLIFQDGFESGDTSGW